MEFLQSIKNTHFIQSFKLKKNFLYVSLYDIIFYGILALALSLFVKKIMPRLFSIQTMATMLKTNTGNFTELQTEFASIKSELYVVFGSALLLVIFVFVLYSFMKNLVWKTIYNKKFLWQMFLRYLFVNLILFIVFYIIAKIISYSNNYQITPIVIIAVFILYLYFVNIFHAVLMLHKDKKIKCRTEKLSKMKNFFVNALIAMKDALKYGVIRFYKFLLPYCIIIFILLLIFNLIGYLKFLPYKLYLIIYIIILVCYLGWMKFYIARVVEKQRKIYK